jgi:hypothetical protein
MRFCPGHAYNKPIQPYGYCYVGAYDEEVAKYWGVCWNYGYSYMGPYEPRRLDQEYANEAYRYLAYFAIKSNPGYCAGEGIIPSRNFSNNMIRSASSSAYWYMLALLSTP